MKNTLTFIALLIVTFNAFGQAKSTDISQQFMYKEKPIHPQLVYEFIPWVSDEKPVTVSVDIAAAYKTNEYYENYTVEKDGSIKFQTEEEAFRYKWLGELDNGIHVIRAFDIMVGGSGVFEHLLFIRFEHQEFDLSGEKYTQMIMSLVKMYQLGDRTNSKIKVAKDKVIIHDFFYTNKKKVIQF